MIANTEKALTDFDDAEAVAESLHDNTVRRSLRYDYDAESYTETEEHLYDPGIFEEASKRMQDIIDLCKSNDIDLLLIKIPIAEYPFSYNSSWDKIKSSAVKEYAADNNLDFIDFQFYVDTGIDTDTDYFDGGMHLNYFGARKLSSCLAEYIDNNYDIEKCDNSEMDERLVKYKKGADIAGLQNETDTVKYLELLKTEEERFAVCITAKESLLTEVPEDIQAAFSALGLNIRFSDFDRLNSYAAYIDSGRNVYEEISNHTISWNSDEADLQDISLTLQSAGWYTGSNSMMLINGVDYSSGMNGLNIVVIDKESGLVVDKAYIDAYSDPHICSHSDVYSLLFNYWMTVQ